VSRQMFVNLAVADLDRSVEFFTRLGFTFDQRFTDANATCMKVAENSFVMLLVRDFFATFTTRRLADLSTTTEAILAVSLEDRAAVDDLAEKALAAGGRPSTDPQDHGFMYQRSFADPDGHLWELFWMDPAAVPGQPAGADRSAPEAVDA